MGILSYLKTLPQRMKNCFRPSDDLVNHMLFQDQKIQALTNALVDSDMYAQKVENDGTNRLALVLMKLGGKVTISEEILNMVYGTPIVSIDVVKVGTGVEMTLTLSDEEETDEQS